MLDLARLKRVRLHRRPLGQRLVAELFLRPSYRFPRTSEIVIEGIERIPRDRSVFFAMNHTDRYNYWPFQYALHRTGVHRYVATWVKGKYYEHPAIAWFMDRTNNIPLPSRGYVLTTEFRRTVGRVPTESEYRQLRDLADGNLAAQQAAFAEASPELQRFLEAQGADPNLAPIEKGRREPIFLPRFEELFDQMIEEVVRLNHEALTTYQCHVLVFPQGTRSKRLSRGHTGLAQMSQRIGAPIIPVGVSGSDQLYPGSSPWASGGRAVYRVGPTLEPDGPELAPHRVREDFTPLSREAVTRHGDAFRAITDVVMDHINGLVDPDYQRSDSDESDGVRGIRRFV
ncbi:MAG: 1-acyl-sn-glycerol-3-phosphate acyltransferase [Deltaproteobacteria bacterium]|nr:1-acyl-sn-glycerol-3-phosphate acyltransferase [Deltaproteobacteria bacterium]